VVSENVGNVRPGAREVRVNPADGIGTPGFTRLREVTTRDRSRGVSRAADSIAIRVAAGV
jgi:hypothetical protein